MSSPERTPISPEARVEREPLLERSPEIKDTQQERSTEQSPEETEQSIERAKAEASAEAISGREVSRGEQEQNESPVVTPITSQTREDSYKHTMKTIQQDLSTPERIFSTVIHNRVVEKVSDVAGKTIARPDAILSGSIFACIFVLGLYLLAHYNGFALQGSETIIAFVIGWLLGLVFDFLRTMIAGKHQ